MAVLTADFSGGVDGATISTGDAGHATAWDAIVATDPTFKYSNEQSIHSTLSGKFSDSGAPSTAYAEWSTALGTVTDHYGRAYLYFPTPADVWNVNYWIQFLSSGTPAVSLAIGSGTRNLLPRDSAGGGPDGAVAHLLDQWIRLEWHIVHSATVGSIQFKLFNTADSTSPDDVVTATNLNTLASANQFRIGQLFTGETDPWYVGPLLVNGASYPGPITAGAAATGGFLPLMGAA